MKKTFKIIGLILLSLFIIIEIAFVFVLPNVINLANYKEDIQTLVKEQAKLDLDYRNAKLVTTPLFGVGVKMKDVKIKLPDRSLLFSADNMQARIALPSLLVFTLKVSCFEIENPLVNIEIQNDENYKIVKIIEDIINEQKLNELNDSSLAAENQLPFDISKIRIKVPNAKLKNYNILIRDLKSKHNLALRGKELTLGYFNGKKAKIKTEAKLFSDEEKNINANIDITTFIPKFEQKLDSEDDESKRIEIPFTNPVTVYRNYNLKANLDTKIKILSEKKSFGYFNLEDVTMKISDIELPKSYALIKTFGSKVSLDTNINVTKTQNLNLLGEFNYGKKPNIDMSIKSSKINFEDLRILSKAFLDSLQIKNDLNLMEATGSIKANAAIRTDFKKLKSTGSLIVENGGLSIKNLGNIISKANINLLLNENILNIENSSLLIQDATVNITGKIDKESVANINLKADKIPLPVLYNAFAPKDIKNQYILNSGVLSFDFELKEKIKNIAGIADIKLNNLNIADKKKTFIVTNSNLSGNIKLSQKNSRIHVNNNDLNIILPQTNSKISSKNANVVVNDKNVQILENYITLNDSSKIKYTGNIQDYTTMENTEIAANGNIHTKDLIKFLGKDVAPYFNAKGTLPLNASFSGDSQKLSLLVDILADEANYITPINIKSLIGKTNVLQVRADFKPNRVKIKETGLYTQTIATDDKGNSVKKLNEIIGFDGTIAGDTINLLKINLPENLSGNIHLFPNSSLNINKTRIFVLGNIAKPMMYGNFNISDIIIPEISLALPNTNLNLNGHRGDFSLNNLKVDNSDFHINGAINLVPSNIFTISSLNINSNYIDADRLTRVSNNMNKYTPQPSKTSAKSSDIPVAINDGGLHVKNIKSGNINLTNTHSRLFMRKNIFHLTNLRTQVFGGFIHGNISTNLVTSLLNINVKGKNINTEDALWKTSNIKDTLYGTSSFIANLSLRGSTYNEQMKSLRGNLSFSIQNGQFGPFGKIENMILAENIRNSQFFSTAIGGIVNSLATIDTTHFSELNGNMNFSNGICHIQKLTSQGKILSLFIVGDFNLLNNQVNMKARVKISSFVSQLLGPIALINPVNLVNSAASLNVFTAKAFSLFCETLSSEEINAIPPLNNAYDDSTALKFQLGLRGDVNKPLSLIKSFKWIATTIDFQKASDFVSSIPTPAQGSKATTVTEVIQENEKIQAEQKTVRYRLFHSFKKKKKVEPVAEPEATEEPQAEEQQEEQPSEENTIKENE